MCDGYMGTNCFIEKYKSHYEQQLNTQLYDLNKPSAHLNAAINNPTFDKLDTCIQDDIIICYNNCLKMFIQKQHKLAAQ